MVLACGIMQDSQVLPVIRGKKMHLCPALQLIVCACLILLSHLLHQTAVKEGNAVPVIPRHPTVVKEDFRPGHDLPRFHIKQHPDIVGNHFHASVRRVVDKESKIYVGRNVLEKPFPVNPSLFTPLHGFAAEQQSCDQDQRHCQLCKCDGHHLDDFR